MGVLVPKRWVFWYPGMGMVVARRWVFWYPGMIISGQVPALHMALLSDVLE